MKKSSETVTLNIQPLLTPLAIVFSALMLSAALLITGISIGNGLNGANINAGVDGGGVAGADTNPPTEEEPIITSASVDDDARLGSADAKVVIVEFSDYECPFCQRFYNDTYSQIKEQYIDSGDVALVFRDLPLSFHDPEATYAANVVECAREQGGDKAYFQMHDFWFDNTVSNGEGISDRSQIRKFANGIGLDGKKVLNCAENGNFDAEIQKDANDASAAGVTGTPGFVVGTVEDGVVTGELIAGAYPFAEFERVIEQYL